MATLQTISNGTHATVTVNGTSNTDDLGLLINPSSSESVYIHTLNVSNLLEGIAIRTNQDGTNGSVTILTVNYDDIGGNVLSINRPDVNVDRIQGYTRSDGNPLSYEVYHPHVIKMISTDPSGLIETPSVDISNIFIKSIYIVNKSYINMPVGLYGKSIFDNIKLGENELYIQSASQYLLRAFALINSVIGGMKNSVSVNNNTGFIANGISTGSLFSIVNNGQVSFISGNTSLVGFVQENMFTDYHEGFWYCPVTVGINCVQGVTDASNRLKLNIDTLGQPILRALPPVPLMTDTPDEFNVKAEAHLLAWETLLDDLKNYATWVASRTFQSNGDQIIPTYSLGLQLPPVGTGDEGKHLVVNADATQIAYETLVEKKIHFSFYNFNNLI